MRLNALKRGGLYALGAAILALGSVRPAVGQTQLFDYTTGSETASFTYSLVGLANGVSRTNAAGLAGRYVGRLSGEDDVFNQSDLSFKVFCTDISHYIAYDPYQTLTTLGSVTAGDGVLNEVPNTSGRYYYTADADSDVGMGLASALVRTADYGVPGPILLTEAQRRSEAVAFLVDRYINATNTTFNAARVATGLNATTLNQHLAAVQIAVWKIAQDGLGTGNWTTGTFRVSALNGLSQANAYNLLNYYMADAALAPTDYASDALWIQGARNADATRYSYNGNTTQDFATSDSPPIPEPAFYQLAALLGLGGFGLLRMRRKARS